MPGVLAGLAALAEAGPEKRAAWKATRATVPVVGLPWAIGARVMVPYGPPRGFRPGR